MPNASLATGREASKTGRNGVGEGPLRVVVVGGGIAALELVLALDDLAAGLTEVLLIAPNREFVYRPHSAKEPFGYGRPRRRQLRRIARDAGAELLVEAPARVDSARQVLYTAGGERIAYDALALAVAAEIKPRFEHALTLDERYMDELLGVLAKEVEQGIVRSIGFLIPGRISWPLPLYELALMIAARAEAAGVKLRGTIVTPEDMPLAIFGQRASDGVARLLAEAGVKTLASAYAEVPKPGCVWIEPGDGHLQFDRLIALPELHGPALLGMPEGHDGFIRVDRFCQVPDVGPIFAAGDAVEFPVKHGGISAQQADVAACAIAALAGASVQPRPFEPVMHAMLLTGGAPRYLSARITGGHGFSSVLSRVPSWSPPGDVVSKYLAAYLEALDGETTEAG
ncbi:MAG TPA: hypothetical protein VGF95_13920 [Solirubrobacteraceae bacterium]